VIDLLPDRVRDLLPDRVRDLLPDRVIDLLPDRVIDLLPDRVIDLLPDILLAITGAADDATEAPEHLSLHGRSLQARDPGPGFPLFFCDFR